MKPQEFDVIVEARIEKIRNVLKKKATEYATGGDRFHNFKVAAGADTTTAARALWGMFLKHYVSVKDIVDRFDPNNPDKLPSRELLDEKIGDSINYLILLEGIVIEAIEQIEGNRTQITISGDSITGHGGTSNAVCNTKVSVVGLSVSAANKDACTPKPGWLPRKSGCDNE